MSPGTLYNPSLIRMLDIAIRGGLFWIYNITCQPGEQCSTTGLISFLILQIVQSIPYPGSFVLVLKAPLRSRWMLFICQSIFRLVETCLRVLSLVSWSLLIAARMSNSHSVIYLSDQWWMDVVVTICGTVTSNSVSSGHSRYSCAIVFWFTHSLPPQRLDIGDVE